MHVFTLQFPLGQVLFHIISYYLGIISEAKCGRSKESGLAEKSPLGQADHLSSRLAGHAAHS